MKNYNKLKYIKFVHFQNMANVVDSQKLICALSFKNDQHFVQHAFKLSCNHFVCKKCLEAFSSRYTDLFRCGNCGQDCKTKCESDVENEIEKLYPDLLKALVKDTDEKINSIESNFFVFNIFSILL